MERELTEQLLQWKDRPERKPLILKGARQVGKTWLLKEFGEKYYKSVAYLSCDNNLQARSIFEEDFDIRRIFRDIEAATNTHIVPGETLVILDEIQELPRALQSLKYFCETAPEYHVCAAGSLLGISLHKESSFPVGKVDTLTLYPLSFPEFVLAVEGELAYQRIRKGSFEESKGLRAKWIDLLRQYYYTGGMPAVVKTYIAGKSLKEVRRVQNQILADYRDDISKHTDSRTAVRIHQVWNSIAQQLTKENKKFFYGHIQKGARAKDFELAIQWLLDAGIVYRIPCVRKAGIPLKFYEDFEAFKLFYVDCGLMGAISEAPAKQVLIGNTIFSEYKGAFTEQYVLQQVMASSESSIYYFNSDSSKQEIDFMVQNEDRLLAIEVKAEENLRAKSLKMFHLDHPEAKAIRVSMSDYRKEEWLINLPLYLVSRLFEL